jgi:hypothetical protein
MNQEQSGSRKIGKHIVLHWRCVPAEAACEIKLWRDGALLIAARMARQGSKPVAILPFNLRQEGEPVTLTGSFELAFNHAGTPQSLALDLDEHDAGMKRYQLWPAQPEPIPPVPPEPAPQPVPEPFAVDADVAAARIEEDMDADLFPYLYLRPWTGAGKQELADNFIAYLPAPHGLYERLVKAKAKGRTAMEKDAVQFVEEQIPEATAGLARLPLWLRRFPGCYDALRALREPDADALRREVEAHLECSWNTLREHVHGKEFAPAMDLCWQAVMALNILLGDRRRQLNAIIKTIVLGHLLSRMFLLGEEGGGDGALALPLHGPDYWTPSRIADGLAATPILPEALFPLPAAKEAGAANEERDTMAIYAIGDLELVRQRLKGYALGEVSRIENVMRGESVETTRRQLSRTSLSTSERTRADASSESDWSGTSSHRLDRTTRSLNLDFTIENSTKYGPPSDVTATETLKISPNTGKEVHPQQEAIETAAGHARTVTSRSVARLARRVEWERASTTLDEREDTVVARLDGSGNERNVRGIYRWVDKIYEAYVVNYGHRLMLEFTLAQPAAAFVHDQQLLCGRSLLRPQPPGLSSYTDISSTPGTQHYYAAFIDAYDAFDAPLPPAGSRTLSISARVSTAGSCQEVAIPDGYQAIQATVSANWPGQGQAPDLFGLVGTHPFAFSPKDRTHAAGGSTTVLKLSGETGNLPFSIALAPRPSALDAAKPQPLPPACVASVDITLAPTPAALGEWQFGFYRAIQQAYRSRLREWLESVGAGETGDAANPLAGRQAVQQTLGRRMRQVLWRHAVDTAGAAPRDQARYEQFFNQAFEWKEMSYSLGEGWGAGELAAADSPLSAFIEADAVRVLLPVHPSSEQCIPYFIESGMLWDGDRRLVPAMAEAVDLVGDLKQCHGRHHEPVRSGCWQFRVPTTMTVIQQSEELPTF